MRKLTSKERVAWRAELEQRQTPEAMKHRWYAFHANIGEEMLVQAGVEFMRDGYAAHRLAQARGAAEVWLVAEHRPDFGLSLNGADAMFEFTEADWPDRKRAKEYEAEVIPRLRAGTAKAEYAPELLRMTPGDAFKLLRQASLKKSDGRYDKTCSLLILLQPNSYEVKKVEAIMADATSDARPAFREVWVHWSSRFYLLWQDGERVEPKLTLDLRE